LHVTRFTFTFTFGYHVVGRWITLFTHVTFGCAFCTLYVADFTRYVTVTFWTVGLLDTVDLTLLVARFTDGYVAAGLRVVDWYR